MNTKIYYLYRDASNYKQLNTFVCEGEYDQSDVDRIIASLQDGEYFIPENVGLPCERFTDWTEDDHLYCEMDSDDFELTSDSPDSILDGTQWRPITVSELAGRFEAAADDGWTAILM